MTRSKLQRLTRAKTLLHTGLDPRVEFGCPTDAWATAEISFGTPVFKFDPDVLKKPDDFLHKLIIHELAHIVDRWLHNGPRRTKTGRILDHDAVWRKLCVVLGDPDPRRIL